ncbi:Ribosomal protein S24e family protein [Forsythia ovata]|uniref:Ribosomal protein S24e family protein n=1 Tax=Forsythia ovata TaxID=205694 RepID=A0ABD1T9Q3_9LAMI
MNLLNRASMKSIRLIQMAHQNQGLASIVRGSSRFFSTEADDANQGQSQDPSNPFLQNPSSGLVYGRLSGITKHTAKSDVVNLLEGCNLGLDDVKVEYSRSYMPSSIMLQFPSRNAYNAALRGISRKGRLFRLERADRSQWDLIAPFDGKAILLQGIPRNALPDDIERFLTGCQYDASSMQIFMRQTNQGPIRMAVVRFLSPASAAHAQITKNRGFCLNNQISVQVLQ